MVVVAAVAVGMGFAGEPVVEHMVLPAAEDMGFGIVADSSADHTDMPAVRRAVAESRGAAGNIAGCL